MQETPQAVSSRYHRNLLIKGKNNDFEVLYLTRDNNVVDEVVIGIYYKVDVKRLSTGIKQQAAGVTPEQAVQRALQKHGVSFR